MVQSQHEIKINETRNSGLVRWSIDIAELVTFCFAGNISENM